MTKRTQDFFGLILSILICESAGIIGSFFTASAVRTWYVNLAKPALNPPSWVFGPVWTILYALMGIAVFLVWKRGWQHKGVKRAMVLFGIQLVLNATWSLLFFAAKSPGSALINVLLLWLSILGTIILFFRIEKRAAALLVPYLLWVSFATYLNYEIFRLN